MSFTETASLILLIVSCEIAIVAQEVRQLPDSQASASAPSPEAIKQATQVIQAATTQTSQKADSALKAVEVTQASNRMTFPALRIREDCNSLRLSKQPEGIYVLPCFETTTWR
jgi:hypothetical protein